MKRSIWIMSLLFAVSTTRAATITDDFNRADTSSSTDTSLIGADWAQSAGSPNQWRIHSNTVYSLTSLASGVMYNTAQQTKNGDGGSFTLSLDVAGLASNAWSGVAFNYNNPSNFYTVRFKGDNNDYQFLGMRADGTFNVIATGHASTDFTVGSFYTITVSSDTAYTYDFTIKEAGSGTVVASETGKLDDESLATGGYAGLYPGSTSTVNEYARFDNFSLDAVVVNGQTVSDDFNRTNVDYTADTSLIGPHWKQPGTTNTWSIGNGGVYSYVKESPGILYNDELETTSGNGTNFTLSLDVALRHNTTIWGGITWNYQNVTNQYILRMKETTDIWQLLYNDGGLHVLASGHAPEIFAAETYYTLSITSTNAYQFDYSIVRNSDSAVFASGSATDSGSLYTGGYAGFYQDTTGGAHAKIDNFKLTVSSPVTGGYAGWAAGWGVDIGAETNDYDGDGLVNLYEYGLGGDPTDPLNQGTSPEFGIVNISGTNWFGYVYPQLSDPDSGLSYSLELNTNLVSGTWVDSGYTIAGTNMTGGSLDFVTNVTDTVAGEKFIRLIIE